MPTQRPTQTPAHAEDVELNPRYRGVLVDIIQSHIAFGEPVGSRTISKHGRQRLSAASIRNVMADLEELGLLRQPHTSAGRVPTPAAYRLYVEALMRTRQLAAHERRFIRAHLDGATADADHLMSATSQLLSKLSHQVGIVMTPAVEEIVLKTVDFVALGGDRVLCVLVSTGNFIDHLVIEAGDTPSREDLVRISNYVTENFAGWRLRDIRDELVRRMAEERRHVDDWLRQALRLASRAVAGSGEQAVLLEGASGLLGQPELADVETIRRMLDTFADKARLVELLNLCLAGDGVRVVLGDDSAVTSELDFSLVATSYGVAGQPLGTLGILGPTRMQYPRIVPLVRYLGESLSEALAMSHTEQ